MNVAKPEERPSQPELRYRIADFVNDRLKTIPLVHATLKGVAHWFQHRGDVGAPAVTEKGLPSPEPSEPSDSHAVDEQPEMPQMVVVDVDSGQAEPGSLDALPFPPEEMRQLVGVADLESFDNPTGALVYSYLHIPAESYETVFDFGCGCGRVARQLLLQRPSPKSYVGVDLHAGMIRWCNDNLHRAAPHFRFYHHDVFNVRSNPGDDKPMTAPFPVADAQFTFVNAHSVFTHLTQEQAEYYLQECARVLHPRGVLHGSWFLFDKTDHPVMGEGADALYLSYTHPSDAVFFDRKWVQNTARRMGLRVYQILQPVIRGYQWTLLMTHRTDVPEIDIPPDTAPRGFFDWERGGQALSPTVPTE